MDVEGYDGCEVLFHQVYPALSQSVCCAVLRLNSVTILLDCGLPEDVDEGYVEALKELASTVQIIALSQPTLRHAGGLPLLYKFGCKGVTIGTLALHRLARLCCTEALLSRLELDPHFQGFAAADIDVAFALDTAGGPFKQLRFMEDVVLEDITFTPCTSGYALGGAVWRIEYATESIVYAPEFNHKSERLLGRSPFPQEFKHPSALIVSATCVSTSSINTIDTSQSEKPLIDAIVDTCRRGGNAVIPCDGVGRTLELILRLESAGRDDLPPVYYISPLASRILATAQTLLEYMHERWSRDFIDARALPFRLTKIQHLRSFADLQKKLAVSRQSVCVISPFPTAFLGAARQALLKWAADPRTCIIVPDSHVLENDTVISAMLKGSAPDRVSFLDFKTVPLMGSELREYIATQAALRKKIEVAAAAKNANAAVAVATMEERSEPEVAPESSHTSHPLIDHIGKFPLFQKGSEKQMGWSAYGWSLDLPALPESEERSSENASASPENAFDLGSLEEVPTKTINFQNTMELRARCLALCLEGRADTSSFKIAVDEIIPRRVILLSGSAEGKLELRTELSSVATDVLVDVSAPTDISSHDLALTSRIRSTVYKGMRFQDLRGVQVAFLEAVMEPPEGVEDVILGPLKSLHERGHAPVLLRHGALRIPEIKKKLQKEGIECRIFEGGLVSENGIIVTRESGTDDTSAVQVEGPICDEYFKVRDILYGMHELM